MKLSKINRQSIGISGFTSVLSRYEGMPKTLFIAGELPAERRPTVAIVGSRRPTSYGKEVTQRLARELAQSGVVIISGLAYGVDAIAHEAALDAGGTTIAILASGLHDIYPKAHRGLAERIIAQGGAIISEQELGVDAHKYHFLARNRLVSGLADAIIVTEATDRSGTSSTVSHAIAQNKEIFAVPGPITSLLSVGPNRIIQDGARVLLTAQDVLRIIAPQLEKRQSQLPLGDTPEEVRIIATLQTGSHNVDQLSVAASVSVATLLQTLTFMELKGTIQCYGGRWSLRE